MDLSNYLKKKKSKTEPLNITISVDAELNSEQCSFPISQNFLLDLLYFQIMQKYMKNYEPMFRMSD